MNEILFFIIVKVITVIAVFAGIMLAVAYSTLFERKFASFFQDRVGPNRSWFFGILQPMADGLKFFFKEDMIPFNTHKALFFTAPILAFVASFAIIAFVPFGDHIVLFGENIYFEIMNSNISLLLVLAFSSLTVFGYMLGGWASNNKYSMLGGLRSSSQMISYELAMGISLIGVILIANTLNLRNLVEYQIENYWFIVSQPLGFFIFLVTTFAECSRTPFDLPEAENELVGGYHTEYSSFKFSLFQLAEYGHLVTASLIMAVIFLGGWDIPFVDLSGFNPIVVGLLGVIAIVAKTAAFIFLFMWVRWTIPRFRYDQIQRIGWKVLLPLALINLVATMLWNADWVVNWK